MALTIQEVSHIYGGCKILHNISFTVEEGKFCCITGSSGCGKTTLLRIIAGLIEPFSGRVRIDDKPLNCQGGDIGFVFQEGGLFPWRTVEENVTFGLEILGIDRAKRRDTANQYLDLVGLNDFNDHYPEQLSGGMKKRAALARALAYKPRLLLLDEPFTFLDELSQRNLQKEILRIWETEKITVVFVTNNAEEAVYLSDEILVFSTGPAQLREKIENSLPRPRDRGENKFLETRKKILHLLENDWPKK